MTENELAKIVVNLCLKIHKILGPGLLESVYEEVLVYELKKLGLNALRQVDIAINYDASKWTWVSGQIFYSRIRSSLN